MKENRMDRVLTHVDNVLGRQMDYLNREYGKVRPFNTKTIDPVDKLYTYEKLMLPENQQIIQQLIMKHGLPAFMEYTKQRERQKEARGL